MDSNVIDFGKVRAKLTKQPEEEDDVDFSYGLTIHRYKNGKAGAMIHIQSGSDQLAELAQVANDMLNCASSIFTGLAEMRQEPDPPINHLICAINVFGMNRVAFDFTDHNSSPEQLRYMKKMLTRGLSLVDRAILEAEMPPDPEETP